MLFLCKFTDYALNLEIAENNIYNKDKICLSKILISETEIKRRKTKMSKKNCESEARKKDRCIHRSNPGRDYSHQEEQMDT